MQILEHNALRLVTRHKPILQYFLSCILMVLGLTGTVRLSKALANLSHSYVLLPMLALAGLGLVLLYRADVVTCTCDRLSRTVTIHREGLWRNGVMRCAFEQIQGIELLEHRHRGQPNYWLSLTLYSGQRLAVVAEHHGDRHSLLRLAQNLSRLMNVPLRKAIAQQPIQLS